MLRLHRLIDALNGVQQPEGWSVAIGALKEYGFPVPPAQYVTGPELPPLTGDSASLERTPRLALARKAWRRQYYVQRSSKARAMTQYCPHCSCDSCKQRRGQLVG